MAAASKVPLTKESAPAILKKKRQSKGTLHGLPFVDPGGVAPSTHYWHVPATGGYIGGNKTGEAMALAFLKFKKDAPPSGAGSDLTLIVESFAARFEEEGGAAMAAKSCSDHSAAFDALRGQCVGFFNTLDFWLEAAAKHLGNDLDRRSDDELLSRMNSGLAYVEAAPVNTHPGEGEQP